MDKTIAWFVVLFVPFIIAIALFVRDAVRQDEWDVQFHRRGVVVHSQKVEMKKMPAPGEVRSRDGVEMKGVDDTLALFRLRQGPGKFIITPDIKRSYYFIPRSLPATIEMASGETVLKVRAPMGLTMLFGSLVFFLTGIFAWFVFTGFFEEQPGICLLVLFVAGILAGSGYYVVRLEVKKLQSVAHQLNEL